MRRNAEEDATASEDFHCTLKELKELMQVRGPSGYQKIQTTYNGVIGLCKSLKTSPNEGKLFSNMIKNKE